MRKQNQGLNNNQHTPITMHPASSHADNSASYQNYPNNPPSEQPNNPFKAELTAAQAAYLTRLLPTFYSFQLDARSARRLPSSSKQVHEVKPPAEPKRKSTKDETEPKLRPPSKPVSGRANQRGNNKSSGEYQDTIYQKYSVQKEVARRNSYQGLNESLRPCVRILNLLKNSRTSWLFREPVDPVALKIPHYTEIIKEPMDLSTIENNLRTNQYITPTQFHADVSKIITNSYTFNSTDTEIIKWTAEFENYYRKITAEPQSLNRTYSQTQIPQEMYPTKSGAEKKKKEPKEDSGPNPNAVISMNEKKELGLNIKKLPKEHMKGILDIVNEGKVKTVGEFDLKELDAVVIRKLQQYVREKLSGDPKNKQPFPSEKPKERDDKEESSFELDQEDES